MKKSIIIIISAAAFVYTIWYMHFGELTTIEGALSKTGIIHPFLFAIWGTLVYAALYLNIFYLYLLLNKNWLKALIPLSAFGAIGMLLTLTCRFGKEFGFEYYLHCGGSLAFSIITSVIVFTLYLLNSKKHWLYKAATITTGILLITDLVFLIIYKQNALIEAVPILFALVIMPVTILINKEKTYASR